MDFSVRFPEDHEHDHGKMEEIEIFAIEDEDGIFYYDKIYVMERDGKTYWICQELSLEGDEVVDRGDFIVFEALEIDGEDHVKFIDDENLEREILEEFDSILEEFEDHHH